MTAHPVFNGSMLKSDAVYLICLSRGKMRGNTIFRVFLACSFAFTFACTFILIEEEKGGEEQQQQETQNISLFFFFVLFFYTSRSDSVLLISPSINKHTICVCVCNGHEEIKKKKNLQVDFLSIAISPVSPLVSFKALPF